MFTLHKGRGLKEPPGIFQNTGHELIHHIASHIYGQEHGSGNNIKSGQRSNESDGTKEGEWTMGQDKREKRGEYGHKVEQMSWLKEPFLCNDDKVEQTSSAPPLTPDHLSGCKNQPWIRTPGPP